MKAKRRERARASISFAAGSALAMDEMKKGDAMSKDAMTMQQCNDHMVMAKKRE